MTTFPANKVNVFIAASKEDQEHLKRLQTQLAPLAQKNHAEFWSYQDTRPGAEREAVARNFIASARLAILLVSSDFLVDANFLRDWPLLQERAQAAQGLKILPVIVNHCLFEDSELARFEPINDRRSPIATMRPAEQEKAWSQIASFIGNSIQRLSTANPSQAAIPPTDLAESISNGPATSEGLNMRKDEYDLELNGEVYEKLVKALTSAFPSESSLRMMVSFTFNENLYVIAGGQNLNQIVFNLVEWAESHDKVKALVRGASKQNPDNTLLKKFKDNYL